MTIRYIIVDDEAPSRINLRLAMDAYPDWHLAAECDDVASARAALASHPVDVVFLDIQMPGQSGLVLARELTRLREPPLVIFVTAWSDHAIEAFEVHALDYLLKPLADARLAQALERSAMGLALRPHPAHGAALRRYVAAADAECVEKISVRSTGRIERISVAEILRIESAGNYVELRLASRTLLHRMPLSRLERMLAPGDFVRVHRGSIVQRKQIARLDACGEGVYRLTLRCGDVVAVSERYVGALKLSL